MQIIEIFVFPRFSLLMSLPVAGDGGWSSTAEAYLKFVVARHVLEWHVEHLVIDHEC